jgi:cobalt/nickel transport system permease protein
MQFEGLERTSAGTGPLHRLDARFKLIGAIAFIVIVIATPFGARTLLGVEGLVMAFTIGLSGISPRHLGRTWLRLLVLVGLLTLMVAPAHPERARHGLLAVAATILAKNGLALLAMLVLAGTTPLHKLLAALRKLGMPRPLVATLQFMDRYRHVFRDELNRMATARKARSFNRRGSLAWGLRAGLIGILFLRTFERAERVHGAMIARGWDGAMRTLGD